MKRLLLFAFLIPLLSLVTVAQIPSPSVAPTTNQTSDQASPSPTPNPITAGKGIPNLPYMVEILASAVMLGGVLGVLLIVWRLQALTEYTINPRHIQFISVCLIVPTILILGLEKVLTSETSATLIGGLAGYLLSNLGKYDPGGDGGNGDLKKPKDSGGKKSTQGGGSARSQAGLSFDQSEAATNYRQPDEQTTAKRSRGYAAEYDRSGPEEMNP